MCFCKVVYYGASKTVILASELSVWHGCLASGPLALQPSPSPLTPSPIFTSFFEPACLHLFTPHTRILVTDVHFGFLEMNVPPASSPCKTSVYILLFLFCLAFAVNLNYYVCFALSFTYVDVEINLLRTFCVILIIKVFLCYFGTDVVCFI